MYQKINYTGTNENGFSESILPKVFYPNGAKCEKYLIKNFVCKKTGKTVKKFRDDPEEPLNKLPIKEIDNFANFRANFMRICKKKCLKNCKNISRIIQMGGLRTLCCGRGVAEVRCCGQFVIFPYGCLAALCTVQSASSNWWHLPTGIRSLPTFLLNLESRPLSRHADP